jgi:2-phosphoglycerate kinase
MAITKELVMALSNVLWIGGAPDTGKTTISQIIAKRNGFQIYTYDQHDQYQMELLSQTIPRYHTFLKSSLEERWVTSEPKGLLNFLLMSFQDRFPLVIEDLLSLPREPIIIAEGFGLTPMLLSTMLLSKYQAIFLVPTKRFKKILMEKRHKPSFRNEILDPDSAKRNIYQRDILLGEEVKAQAMSCGLAIYEVDGTHSIEEMSELIEQHFDRYLCNRTF